MKPDALRKRSARKQAGAGVVAALQVSRLYLLFATLAFYVMVLPGANTIALRSLVFLGLFALTLALLVDRKHRPRFPLWQAWLACATVVMIGVLRVNAALAETRN